MKNGLKLVFAALLLGGIPPGSGFGQPPRPPQLPAQKGIYPLPPGLQFPVSVPCLPWRGLPMVTGVVNGKPQRFILDTGLNAVTVSPKVQAALALPPGKSRYRVAALDNAVDAPAVAMKDLGINALFFQNTEAVALNVWAMLSPQTPPNSPECWLGTPFLSAFQVTFDLKNNTMLFDSPKADAPKSDGAITLPLTLKGGRIFARLSVPGGKAFPMLIDTGAPATVLPLSVYDRLKIKPFRTQVIRLANRRGARAAQWAVPALQMGGATLKDQGVVSIAPDDPKDLDPDFGLLGMDILSRYRVTINYARLKMTLIPYP